MQVRQEKQFRKQTKPGTVEMKEAITNLNTMMKTTNYNKWMFDRMKPYLGERILEIGCGIGNMTELFLKNKQTELVVGIDISSQCLDIINDRLGGHKKFKSYLYDVCNENISELKKYNFDTIVCVNVLEHIENDTGVLKNMAEFFPAVTLITWVPALKKLYGTIDEADSHFRRYSKQEIETKLRQSGWKILKGSYLNLLGMPVWFLHGKLLKKSLHPPKQTCFLDQLIFLEVLLEKIINPPFGLSLLYICKHTH